MVDRQAGELKSFFYQNNIGHSEMLQKARGKEAKQKRRKEQTYLAIKFKQLTSSRID
jgi:hypothetical protein